MSKKLVQIIIPVYNVEQYLDEFLKSVQNQKFQDFELIIVEDCSTDNTYSKLCQYKEKMQFTIIKNSRNMQLSGSRNVGLDYASKNPAEYITFLDPDDYLDADYLQDLVENALRYNADLCISGIQRFDDTTGKIICQEMIHYPEKVFSEAKDCDEFAFINPCAYSKLYRFEKIEHIRFREIKRSEDTCYLFEILPYLKNIKFTNHAFYHYRVRSTSLSGALDRIKYESMHVGFAKMLPMFLTDKYLPYKEMFEAQIFIRSSLGGVARLAFNDLSCSEKIIKEEKVFLNTRVPGWKKNQYLSVWGRLPKNVKQLVVKCCGVMYRLNCFIVFIYVYYFMTQILKKDVRA